MSAWSAGPTGLISRTQWFPTVTHCSGMRTAVLGAVEAMAKVLTARQCHPKVPSARSIRRRSLSPAAGALLSPAASCCLVQESLALLAYCGGSCSDQPSLWSDGLALLKANQGCGFEFLGFVAENASR